MRKGLLVVVSGPSGAGKGTICQALLEKTPLAYSVSATTRKPRAGEVDGESYYFLSVEAFEKMIEKDELLEWAKVYDNYYGTPLKKVEEKLAAGEDILLEIDTQGAMKVREKFPEGVYVFILPPSLAELERRIRGRDTETEDVLQKRLAAAIDEIEAGKCYKYVVTNDEVDGAVDSVCAILAAERRLVARNGELFDEIEKGREDPI
ncbi:guanylate kinase [Selenomonas sputigena]|uniref:Guanylate kinase n=1 Tax=Selenomonas sputigena (strain ATCC 35185 / DSM 20758 / CCUG 44933 / VPI D19B-28) TaxID=546271 RepID=C9LSX0_SELS3|nr:guanylate kinase [Selenomonas sputigena]AEC00578.1 guanylate kinase [Selenomonas sputigena ATCC 35185]EEX78069.1 guanylate kinase [Selenomonas sputigena ATCC 35185]